MATTIKASCPGCGDVQLTEHDVRLMVCNDASLSYYAFDCPGCRREVRKAADTHVVALLLSGGVPATSWTVPAEVADVARVTDAPALSVDDVLDFAMALADDSALAAAMATLV